jgi:hypothetical protein
MITHQMSYAKAQLNTQDGYTISEVKEGEMVTALQFSELYALIEEYFQDQPVVLICNRVNSFSIDPMIYQTVPANVNIVGQAIVEQPQRCSTFTIEQSFALNFPMDQFYNLEKAIAWAKNIQQQLVA